MKNKLANSLIVGLILLVTVFLCNVASIGESGDLMTVLFIGFFALIIAVQVVPALMLFGFLVKELFSRNKKAEIGVQSGDKR